jgi:hypothetical protein
VKSDGVRGLWRGVNAAVLRTAMVCPFLYSTGDEADRIGIISTITFIQSRKELSSFMGI